MFTDDDKILFAKANIFQHLIALIMTMFALLMSIPLIYLLLPAGILFGIDVFLQILYAPVVIIKAVYPGVLKSLGVDY